MSELIAQAPPKAATIGPNDIALWPTMPPMDSNETARRVRIMRASLGLNQTQFGKLINRGRGAIGNWEKGRPPRDDYTLTVLAARAGFPPSYFVAAEVSVPTPEEAARWRREKLPLLLSDPEGFSRAIAEAAASQGDSDGHSAGGAATG